MTISLQGQVGLIIGASGGIGSAVARVADAAGARLGLFARTPERLEALAGELAAAEALPGDATRLEDLEAAVADLVGRHGRLDFMVHAVGSIRLMPLHLVKEADLEATWRLNLLSPMLAMKACLPTMAAQRAGAIVCVSSVAGHVGLANHEPIAAAKGGLEAVIRAAAMTYAAQHVRINGVAPGLVETPLSASLTRSAAAREASLALHPLGRLGQASDIAEAVMYLLGAPWVTGAIVPVDGGMSAGRHRHA